MSAERDTTAGSASTEGHHGGARAAANAPLIRIAAPGPPGGGAPPAVTRQRAPIGTVGGPRTQSPTAAHAPRERDRAAASERHGLPAHRPPDMWVPFLVLTLSAAGIGMLVLARATRP